MTAPMTPSTQAAPPVAACVEVPAPGGLTNHRDAAGPVLGSASPAAPLVVGIDASLTATGMSDGTSTWLVKSKGSKDATLLERATRLSRLSDRIIDAALVSNVVLPRLVAIEGPSFGQQRQGGQHDRAGLWWLVVEALVTGYPLITVVEVPPATLKTYATGKGNASKDEVLAAVVRRYPDVEVTDNNTADALVLAAMCRRALGCPIDELPQTHLRAMAKVPWPEVTE